ncbi:MAG: hypothetical protein IJG07_10540 [Prevotella sp.]|nr:hypothetical protein [Prevotella sp.]
MKERRIERIGACLFIVALTTKDIGEITFMKNSKRSYKPGQQSLRSLLREIDAEADDYVRRINDPAGRYLANSLALESLLKEMERRHPLSMATRRHGQRLYDRVKDACVQHNNWREDGWLADDIRSAFGLRSDRSLIGSTGRDLLRIAKSFVSPFIALEEKIEVVYAFFGELKKQRRQD